jgi:hypothetical protein
MFGVRIKQKGSVRSRDSGRDGGVARAGGVRRGAFLASSAPTQCTGRPGRGPPLAGPLPILPQRSRPVRAHTPLLTSCTSGARAERPSRRRAARTLASAAPPALKLSSPPAGGPLLAGPHGLGMRRPANVSRRWACPCSPHGCSVGWVGGWEAGMAVSEPARGVCTDRNGAQEASLRRGNPLSPCARPARALPPF